ncbi:hypothetical protein [Duganella sp. BuS-21]|uniref:hypothetical protein n=1 Tax=Duganella sp. BuS-21 TaxID=2943848 RepID=UPI0035A5A6E6
MRDDPELQAIVDQYGPADEDDLNEEETPQLMPWEKPFYDPGTAAWRERVRAQLAAEVGDPDDPDDEPAPKPSRPSKQDLRRAAEQELIQQSSREIYRKLASALHPDREPDPEERDRKTALMQKANAAYEKNDLLALLELQLQIAQIDQAGVNALSDERIGQLNTVMQQQVNAVMREVFEIEDMLRREWDLWHSRRLTPQVALRKIQEEFEQMRTMVANSERDAAAFHDIKQLKAWLKTYRIPAPREDDWDY